MRLSSGVSAPQSSCRERELDRHLTVAGGPGRLELPCARPVDAAEEAAGSTENHTTGTPARTTASRTPARTGRVREHWRCRVKRPPVLAGCEPVTQFTALTGIVAATRRCRRCDFAVVPAVRHRPTSIAPDRPSRRSCVSREAWTTSPRRRVRGDRVAGCRGADFTIGEGPWQGEALAAAGT